MITPHKIYNKTLYIITKVPTVMPNFFAKIIAITSIPSIAPPNLMARPLPTPEMIPPNTAHKNKSLPAIGDTMLTSTGNTSVISHAHRE